LEVQAPFLAIGGQDAEANLASSNDVHPIKVLQHLGRRHAIFVRITLVRTVKRAAPALRFGDGEAVLVSLPLVFLTDSTIASISISEQKRIRDMLAPLGGEGLLHLDIRPAK